MVQYINVLFACVVGGFLAILAALLSIIGFTDPDYAILFSLY